MPVVPSALPAILVSDVIEETKRHMLGSHRAELNRLTSTIAAGATTLTFDFDISGMARGSYIAIDDELIYVWTVDNPSRTITVAQRGQQGTTAASHTSGAIVEINPRFPRPTIKWAIKEEIRSWGPQLYQILSVNIAATSDTRGYDLAALGNFYQILEVRHSAAVSTGETDPKSWPRINGYRLERAANTTDFTSGGAIIIPDAYTTTPLPTLNVVFSAPFDVDTAFTDSTDLIANVGISPSMADIPTIGAAWRLLMTREIKRTFTEGQGEPGDYANVPPNYIGQAAARLKASRDGRIDDEMKKLMARNPMGGWG